jgi:uncharacterized protein involved in response to NO
MLFGFALAVVAGNQLGPSKGARIALLFAVWIGARAAFLAAPASLPALAANAAFAALLAVQVAPRLLRTAKKWRNQALPAVLIGLCVAAAALHVRAAVMLFAMLMLFMGGRILAPMVAGQLQRQGTPLAARVQPRLEAALLIAMSAAVAATLLPGARWLLASSCAAAGGLAAVRILRWRLWVVRSRPDLLCLASGYAWLALGLIAFGAAVALGRPLSPAIHVITVGALGTLTFNVMALSWLLVKRLDPARSVLIPVGTALLAAATISRVLAAIQPQAWLLAAALLWSAAYAVLLGLLIASRSSSSSR